MRVNRYSSKPLFGWPLLSWKKGARKLANLLRCLFYGQTMPEFLVHVVVRSKGQGEIYTQAEILLFIEYAVIYFALDR